MDFDILTLENYDEVYIKSEISSTFDQRTSVIRGLIPLKTLEGILQLEELLASEEQKRIMKTMLIGLGGSDYKTFLHQMLSEVYSNLVAKNCSWMGMRKIATGIPSMGTIRSFRVGNTRCIEIIKEVMRISYPEVTERNFVNAATLWFSFGRQRWRKEIKIQRKNQYFEQKEKDRSNTSLL